MLACAAAACGVTSPSDLKTETWNDAILPGSTSGQFAFTTSKTGEFIVKITALSPDSGVVMTLEYGTPAVLSGVTGCAVISAASAGLNKTAFDIQLPKGTYCLEMVDVNGSLPRPQAFTASVQHL